MNIDLHCHSYISDGALSPEAVVHTAHANGATMLALTDHDNTDGLARAHLAAAGLLTFIDGVEISVTWRKRTIHIVGLNFDAQHDDLQHVLMKNRSGRRDRMHKIAHKIEKYCAVHHAFEGALQYAQNPDSLSRSHMAQFLIDQGVAPDKETAFRRWLGDNKSAFVHHQWATLEEATGAIVQAGGIAVIAHPARYKLTATALRALVEEFIAYGGRAIEVAYARHSPNERLNLALIANRYHLLASCGSDFHKEGEIGITLGKVPAIAATCTPVWEAFNEA